MGSSTSGRLGLAPVMDLFKGDWKTLSSGEKAVLLMASETFEMVLRRADDAVWEMGGLPETSFFGVTSEPASANSAF